MKRIKIMAIAAVLFGAGTAFTTKMVAKDNLIQLHKFDNSTPKQCVEDNICTVSGNDSCLWQSYSDDKCKTPQASFRD